MNETHVAGIKRAFGALMGVVPLGIGLTVIIFLWSATGWDAPPLLFKIFGSFIALAFIVVGSTLVLAAFLRWPDPASLTSGISADVPQPLGGYTCARCGAPLAADADVSPLGDVKCTSCGGWLNIHGRQQ